MARTAIATLQPMSDCRWSRPGYRLSGVTEALQPESRWVCVRDGGRRPIDEEECDTCPHWELNTNSAVSAVTTAAARPIEAVAARPIKAVGARPIEAPRLDTHVIARALLCATLGLIAAGFVASGVAILTSPLAIPVTIGLWICAAALGAFAAFRWTAR